MTAPDRNEQIRGALGGAAVGAALGVLAAFLGEVRVGTPLLWVLLVLGALAGAFRPSRRALHATAAAVALVLAACLLTPVLRGPLAALTLDQPPVKADAIVVLGGGVQCGTRTLESASLARLTRGLELWGQDYAPTLTVSEQSGLIGPRDCPKISTLERQIITRQLGTDGPEVLPLRNVTTTRDEAARVRDLTRTRGWTTVLLVTSPSHSRRAAALFRTYGVNVISVPAPETRFDTTLPLPLDRLWAVRILAYEGLSRVKAALGGTPER
ncbi:YdcF family protein [Deinococcus sp. 6YEL10]|uniref:YdcF family protein n=1 Tax=Deinococcus sp. 6YEL10 TaxID=2745870 RepID=UPI001E2BF32F|nr:YdcF family protein [Deinococcus sp. 6YEL10]MCD0162938.1 YdcF family protein [Deinococcus sp. 6YEL10]